MVEASPSSTGNRGHPSPMDDGWQAPTPLESSMHRFEDARSRRSADAIAVTMSSTDPGAGVTSWLASTPTSKQDPHAGSFVHGGVGNRPSLSDPAESWAKLPQRSGPPRAEQQMRVSFHDQQPPAPPPVKPGTFGAAGGRSSSSGPRLVSGSKGTAASSPAPAAPQRAATGGPSDRAGGQVLVRPAAAAMSLTPGTPGSRSAENVPRRARSQPKQFGLQDDLLLAQQRTQAKLAALKTQLGPTR